MNRVIRLGVDVRDLRLASTGTKTYLEEFLKEASLLQNEVQLIRLDSFWKPYWGNSKWGKTVEHIQFFIWKQCTLPLKALFHGVDVLFCTDYYVPRIKLRARHVVVFHDALFFDHPEYYNPIWLKLFMWIALPAARRADKIIVPSHFSQARLTQFEPDFAGRISVVPQGPKSFAEDDALISEDANVSLQHLSPASIAACKQVNGSRYLLHVGVLEKRKNLATLVTAMKKIREKNDVKLVFIGRPNPKIFNNSFEEVMQAVKSNQLEEHVVFAGYLPSNDLPFWYRNALAYVFPSRYEGFGIPVLEAFHFGVPVAVANNSCLPEIGGDAVLTFSPDSQTELVEALQKLITDEELRSVLIQKGRQRFALFTWHEAAREIIRLAAKL